MKDLESLITRNQRVEMDKAWETSWTRRLAIATLTYGIACLFLVSINVENASLSALVPTGGYLLSTISLSPLKRIWIRAKWPSRAKTQTQDRS